MLIVPEYYILLALCMHINDMVQQVHWLGLLFLQLTWIYMRCMMQCIPFVQGGQICVSHSNCRLLKKRLLERPTVAIPENASGKS